MTFSFFPFFVFPLCFPLWYPVVVPRCSTPGGWVQVLGPVFPLTRARARIGISPVRGRSPRASRCRVEVLEPNLFIIFSLFFLYFSLFFHHFSLFFIIFSLCFIIFHCFFIVFSLFFIIFHCFFNVFQHCFKILRRVQQAERSKQILDLLTALSCEA